MRHTVTRDIDDEPAGTMQFQIWDVLSPGPDTVICWPYGAHMRDIRGVEGGGDDTPRARAGARFGKLLEIHRKLAGLTQEEVYSGIVGRSTYLRWEAGAASAPEPIQVRQVCKRINLDPRLAAIALGLVSEEEMSLPPQSPLDELAAEVNKQLSSPRLTDSERATLRRAVQRGLDSFADAMKLKAPKELSAAERLAGLQVDTEAR